jgi:hypothetical protein
MSNYVVWQAEEVPHCLVLDELDKVDLDVELQRGLPCKGEFPSNAVFTADPEFPNDIGLADNFENTQRLVVVSGKLKEFVESWKPQKVEYLPVTILNHKSRPAGKYFIIHPVEPVDALKPAESGAKFNARRNDRIDSVKRLVLDEERIEASRVIFKLKSFYRCVLIRRDLADAISKAGFTGLKWTECSKYKSI